MNKQKLSRQRIKDMLHYVKGKVHANTRKQFSFRTAQSMSELIAGAEKMSSSKTLVAGGGQIFKWFSVILGVWLHHEGYRALEGL